MASETYSFDSNQEETPTPNSAKFELCCVATPTKQGTDWNGKTHLPTRPPWNVTGLLRVIKFLSWKPRPVTGIGAMKPVVLLAAEDSSGCYKTLCPESWRTGVYLKGCSVNAGSLWQTGREMAGSVEPSQQKPDTEECVTDQLFKSSIFSVLLSTAENLQQTVRVRN